ncbi:hypothetical protein BGP_1999 [Beggiatoa sp. PS]|nr:hypothetical protein BGP_1999 [Beggiatoa sp. PS]
MDWHIITASKGGVGKTLLSLMLLTYFHKDNDKSIFAIDLNGTNSDFRKLCCVEKDELFEPKSITLSSGRSLDLACYPVKLDQQTQYVVGWPSNPYKMLCSASDFFDFLGALKEVTFQFSENFEPNTIIIDTNFHFGNIFSSEPQIYEDSNIFNQINKTNDNFFIWFLWTNRQLTNLISSNNNARKESDILFKTVNHIEEFVKNTNNISSFVHVFNAFNLGNPNSKSLWEQTLNRNRNIIIFSELKRLLNQHSKEVIRFQTLYNRLKKLAGTSYQPTEQGLLLKILDKYAQIHKCSRNMIPLTTHQKWLENYMENALGSPKAIIDNMKGRDIFKDFEVAIERLLEND